MRILRPPFAEERLRRRSDRRIALELKTAWHDGVRELVFELAPRARWRERVVVLLSCCVPCSLVWLRAQT